MSMYRGAMGLHKWASRGPLHQEPEHDLKAGLPPRGHDRDVFEAGEGRAAQGGNGHLCLR